MFSEPVTMEDLDKSAALCSSTAGCSSSGGRLVYSPGSCLSSGYCSDDAASATDDVFFGRHGKDCWMSSADVDTADLLGSSPFDAELSTTAASVICHESVVVDTAVKFDDVVDNWLFNSMSVPSPCVDDDWPLPAPALSTAASKGLDELPTDSVLANLLLNQSAYTAASNHLYPTRPEVEIEKTIPPTVTAETSRKPEAVSSSDASPVDVTTTSSLSATKRTLDADSCESSAARRRRSSPCSGTGQAPEVTSSSSSAAGTTTTKIQQAAACCDCSTEPFRRCCSSETFSTPTSTEVDLCRLSSALRPEWPGLADVISEPACLLESSSDSLCEGRHITESVTMNTDVEERVSETSTESSRTETPFRPVILEALLRSSSKLDANKGSSVALCDQLVSSDDSSPSNQEHRLLHRLLRGELDEADIHRAAEQAAAAAAAASADQQHQQPDAAPGWRRDDDVRVFAELASYCSMMTSADDGAAATGAPAEHNVDDIIATIQVPVCSDDDDWLKRYLGDVFSCISS